MQSFIFDHDLYFMVHKARYIVLLVNIIIMNLGIVLLVNIIIMNLGQNVCLDHLWVRFSECYDTQVSVTGQSWPSCSIFWPRQSLVSENWPLASQLARSCQYQSMYEKLSKYS